ARIGEVPTGDVPPSGGERLSAWAEVAALPFLGGLALLFGGALIARRAARTQALNVNAVDGRPREDAPTVLGRILDRLAALPEPTSPADQDRIRAELDAVLEEDVPLFLDQRASLVERLGVAGFAEMIGHFASLERNVARAWSALTDNVPSEVPLCLTQ